MPATEMPGRLGGAADQEPLAARPPCVDALLPGPQPARTITSLIEQFHYPRLGPGMMWERCAERVEAAGCKVHLEQPRHPHQPHEDGRAVSVETTAEGARHRATRART